jgi:hypothetical protein
MASIGELGSKPWDAERMSSEGKDIAAGAKEGDRFSFSSGVSGVQDSGRVRIQSSGLMMWPGSRAALIFADTSA